MKVYILFLMFEEKKNAESVKKRIKQELGLHFIIDEQELK